jgi:aspartyl-tRNA(Asn)/glutamyl-tRNA(Gln) amidotransferase subunit B
MYQSFVYLEVRILLSKTPGVFVSAGNGAESVDPSVLESVFALIHALGCVIPPSALVERQTGVLPVPPADKKLSGCSVRVAEGGKLDILFHARPKTIHIEEVRLEEDCGRLTHSAGKARMDYTWTGCPSVRLKTTPSFELGEEAELFLNEIRRLSSYLHVVNNAASDGGIRCNAFVSLSKYPDFPDYSVKLRNLNSFNFVRKAVNFELGRQEGILESGGTILSESRLWDERQNTTEFYQKRSGDTARFELVKPASVVSFSNIEFEPVELPETRRQRFRSQYGLSRLRSEFICDTKDRADFFEATVAAGASALDVAHWMASELMRLLNMYHQEPGSCAVTPEKFAAILSMLESGKIHSGIAKQLLQQVMDTGKTPALLYEELKIIPLADEQTLLPLVQKVLSENKSMCRKLSSGEMASLEYLTGQVMKKSGGMAVPQMVKALIKKELRVSIVYVMSFGGAISGMRYEDGSVGSGDTHILRSLISSSVSDIPVQVIPVGQFLSEELEPGDWGPLVAEIAARIAAGTANGIVVTHGTDTLPYTAALLYWLFGSTDVPIVLTASSTLPSEGAEAAENIALACRTAAGGTKGVSVVFGGRILSPLNLKFERPCRDGFTNWNLSQLLPEEAFVAPGPLALQFASLSEPDGEVLRRLFIEASSRFMVCRIYPGFRADRFNDLFGNTLSAVFLELYDTGTCSMRTGDFSLKQFLLRGKKSGCRFYCTSQQQTRVDLSPYVTSMRLWREGAVPMGSLTTESAVALYYAAAILTDSRTECDAVMEEYSELF